MRSQLELTSPESLPIGAPGATPSREAKSLRLGKAMVYAALVAVLLERMCAVAGDLQLWADGSWFLIKIASSRHYYFWVADWKRELFRSRLFTILAEQTPTVLATHLGVHSLHTLSIVFGITLYSHALLSLYLCYRYASQRWYMLFPLLSFFAGTMNVEAYLSTDSHFIVSLYWPVLFILLFREELTKGTLILLLALSIPLVLAYESMLFFGIILAGVCVWRYRKFSRQAKLMVGLAAWYLFGAALALASIIWPFDPSNRSGFIGGLRALFHMHHIAAEVSLLALLCCGILMAVPARLAAIRKPVALIALAGVFYLWLEVFLGHAPNMLEFEVPARVMNLLGPLSATALLLAVLAGWFKPDARTIGLTAIVIGALGFSQAFWNLAVLGRWQGMLATLRYELLLHQGPVAFEDSIMSREQLGPLRLRELHAHWPLLPLSLYAAGRGEIRSIILPEPTTYFPFDPFAPDTLPDLSRYGIRYDLYREALKRNWHYKLGQTLTFTKGGSALQFMRGEWADPEAWATWSSGPDFGVDLPVPTADLDNAALLQAWVCANLSPSDTRMTANVMVNDVIIGHWAFEFAPGFHITQVNAQVPREVLERANPVRIRFHINEPLKSPSELGKASDPRKLGIAFLKMRLQSIPQGEPDLK